MIGRPPTAILCFGIIRVLISSVDVAKSLPLRRSRHLAAVMSRLSRFRSHGSYRLTYVVCFYSKNSFTAFQN